MSVLKRIFRMGKKEKPRTTALAMPLLSSRSAPNFAEALQWARLRDPDGPTIGALSGDDGAFVAPIPGGQVALAFVAAPVPSGDLEGPRLLAWHWPNASADIDRHVAHVICFAESSELEANELRLLHSRVVAGILYATDSIGVYVGSATLARERDAYLNDVKSASLEDLPLFCWIGFNLVGDEEYASAYTTGLKDFGLLELEVRRTSSSWGQIIGFLADVAHYELTGHLQIGDGETIDGLHGERVTVRHSPSEFKPGEVVACVG